MAKCENCYHKKTCIDSANYRNAENCRQYKNESLVLELPCRVGDTVYILIEESEKFGGSYVKEEKVVELSTAGRIWTDSCCYDSDDIGKMLFLTSVDAENALGERGKMRPIDADAINFDEVFGGDNDFAIDIRNAAQNLIDIQPTVEAVKCGHVIIKNRIIGGFENHRCPECLYKWQTDNRTKIQELLCSECGKVLATNYQNYCPNCGARMEENKSDIT